MPSGTKRLRVLLFQRSSMPDRPVFNIEELTVTINGKTLFLCAATHQVWRAKVAGGWFVFTGTSTASQGVTFYPDPEHRWNGGTES